jgi:hypothetical protein
MTLPAELHGWAIRHGITAHALADLSLALGTSPDAPAPGAGSESRVQSQVRLAAPHRDMRLWRNNVGVLKDERGVPVRYGLANDSPGLNRNLKSSDLIGWRKLPITASMAGSHVAQFVSLECKRPGWTYRGDDREVAQARWLGLVAADGGYAKFITDAGAL